MNEIKEYDVIIAGSGVGGLTVARELTRKNKRVLILEQGGKVDSLGNMFTLPRMLEKAGLTPSKEGYSVTFAKTYGGASNIAAGCAFPPPKSMFAPFGIDLTEETEEARQDLWIQKLPDHLIGKTNLRLMDAANNLGYNWGKMDKFIDPSRCEENCGKCMMACPRGAKWTARAFGDEAINGGAELKLNQQVTRVITENGAAIGVETADKERYLAKAVVLSGGVGNVLVLRNSGIKNLGEGFCCDWLGFVVGEIPGMKNIKDNPMSVGTTEHYESDGLLISPVFQHWTVFGVSLFNMGARHLPRFFRYGKISGIMVKIRDEVKGELLGNSSFSKPITKVEQMKLDKGVGIIKKVLIEAGAKADSILVMKPIGAHPSCTCRIGETVDSNLETEIRNLYCCDASVFPSAMGAPTIWSIVALGKRLSKHIVQRISL